MRAQAVPRGTEVERHLQPAHVDAVHREHRHARRKGVEARRRVAGTTRAVQPEPLHRHVELVAPVVEVTGDDHALVDRHFGVDELGQPLRPGGPGSRGSARSARRSHAPGCRSSAPARAAGRAARSGGRRRRGGRCRRSASATAARCRARRRASRRWCGRRPRSLRAPGNRPAARAASRCACRESAAPRPGSAAAPPAGSTRSASSASMPSTRLWISSRLRGPTPRTPLWML